MVGHWQLDSVRATEQLGSISGSGVIDGGRAGERLLRVRFQIIGNARIKNVGKSQSCMVSKLPIIWKQV